jgi:hypothetical protein
VPAITAAIPYPGYPSTVQPVEALTAPDHGETDATPAAEAVYWLRHPEIAAATVNTLSAVLDKWESDPEWTGPPEEPDECQE